MAFSIRPAVRADLRDLRHLYEHLNPGDEPLADDRAEEHWHSMLAHPGFTCLVGTDGGSMVTSCCLVVVPNLTRGGRPYALVENVVTHADFRGRGYGRAVVREALSHAWAAGCYKAMLLTGSKRPETLRFYEACGFRAGDKTGFVARP